MFCLASKELQKFSAQLKKITFTLSSPTTSLSSSSCTWRHSSVLVQYGNDGNCTLYAWFEPCYNGLVLKTTVWRGVFDKFLYTVWFVPCVIENGYGVEGASHDKSVCIGRRVRPWTSKTVIAGGSLAIRGKYLNL